MQVLECIDRARLRSEGPGDAAVLAPLLERGIAWTRVLPCDPGDDPSLRELPDTSRLRRLQADFSLPRWLLPGERLRIARHAASEGVGLVWIRGLAAWEFARPLAAELEVPAVIEIGSAAEAKRARRFRGIAASTLALTVAGPGLLPMLHRGRATPLLPPAVVPPRPDASSATAEASAAAAADGDGRAIAVLAGPGGSHGASHLAAIRAIAEVLRGASAAAAGEATAILLEPPLLEHASIRHALRASSLASRASSMPPLWHARSLLAETAAVVLPMPLGRPEPAMLEAVAAGAVVVTVADPAADWIDDRRSAFVVASPRRRGGWAKAIAAALELRQDRGDGSEALRTWRRNSRDAVADLVDPSHRIAAMLGLCSGNHAAIGEEELAIPASLSFSDHRDG
jgi:hypothetical protein